MLLHVVGAGRIVVISACIFVEVCLQQRKRNVYIVAHVQEKHQGERRGGRTGQEEEPQPQSFTFKEY